jgi:ABC-type protease/lipase transport system fused ATPase/permease subunit
MIQLFRSQRQVPVSSELAAALGACLTGSLFMLEVYDRVLPSRSVRTLVALLILTAGLFAAQGFIDAIRSRILVRIGHSLDATMSMRVYDASSDCPS